MRSITVCLTAAMLAFPLAAMAGESLVNGSFEDGTLNGWTIVGSANDYHNPPATVDACGHNLTAADGTYFGGLTHVGGAAPLPTGQNVSFRQTIDVRNWDAGADRTNYDFELWAQLAGQTGNWTDWPTTQTYNIYWMNDGLMPHDWATVSVSGVVANGDTIEVDTAGVNRVYEFDTDGTLRSPSNVAVEVGGAITATVAISGNIGDGDTIEVDTGGITANRVYEFDINNGIRPTSHVAVQVGSGVVTATVTITGNVGDGATVEIDTDAGPQTHVYEFDTNGSCSATDYRKCLDVSTAGGGVAKANARAKLIAAINNDALAPCAAVQSAGDVVTLTWDTPPGGGNGHANGNLVDPTNRIAVTNFADTGLNKTNAKTQLVAAINADAPAPCSAVDLTGTNNATLTWKGGAEGSGVTNTNVNDVFNKITISNFAYVNSGAANARAALIAAVNADASAPCTAAAYGSSVALTWKNPSSGGAANANTYDTNNVITIGDFVSGLTYGGGFDHMYRVGYVSNMAFCKGITNVFDNWRKIKLSGSIPANPQVLVLEIQIMSINATTHNVIDGVVFSAQSAIGSSIGPFAGDKPNSDFETAPYDVIHGGYLVPNPPSDWGSVAKRSYMEWFAFNPANPSQEDDGPIEGYTNGETRPPALTDPLGISTTSGTHFFGRAKAGPNADPAIQGAHNCKGWWGDILEVRNWNPCAVGVRWKIHYLTKMWDTNNTGYQLIELCWDSNVAGQPSIMTTPSNLVHAGMLSNNYFSWLQFLRVNESSTPRASEFAGFEEIEQVGEFSPTDVNGLTYAPQHVLVRHLTSVHGGSTHTEPFKWMYDKIDLYVEAIPGPHPVIRTDSPLPAATCGQAYSQQLFGSGVGNTTWSLVSGRLPVGLTLDAAGLISGTLVAGAGGGIAVFTVQVFDDSDNSTATREFQIPVGGDCCNNPLADLDGDGDVDHVDFAFFQACETGTGGGVPAGCICADLNLDAAGVDAADHDLFEQCASGPGIQAVPTCQ